MDRNVPLYILLLIVFLGAGVTVLFGASVRHVLMGNAYLGPFGETLLSIAELPSLAKQAITEVSTETRLIVKDRFPDIDGFSKSSQIQAGAKEDDGYLLLSSYDKDKGQSGIQLIRIADQLIIYDWTLDINALAELDKHVNPFKRKIVKSSFRATHPLLLKNGGIVFNGASSLFNISPCSEINWLVGGIFHHSNELDADGNIWAPSVMEPSSYSDLLTFRDDAISLISPTGELLFKKSVAKILDENGYRGLLAAGFNKDPIHLNDIQPAHTDSEFWRKGDLLISMRNRSTIMLYRPNTNKIIWLKTGPWMNQHDVDFVGDHEITVFGNDVIDNSSGIAARDEKLVLIDDYNNIYRYDFRTDTVKTPYKDVMKLMEVRTRSEGRATLLEGNDVFIEETNDGRILRLTPSDAKWEFVRRVDDNHLALFSWSRYLTQEQLGPVLSILQNTSCVY